MSSNGKPRRFKNVLRREEFEVEDDKGNVKKFYALGLMGEDREEYMSFMARKTKTTAKGSGGLTDIKGMHVGLLTKCVYYDGSDTHVTEEEIRSWTGEVQGEVFKIAQELSALGSAENEDAAKNS